MVNRNWYVINKVPSAGRPDAGTSGSTTTSAARCSASSRGCAAAWPASVSYMFGARRVRSQPASSRRRQEAPGLARRPGLPRFAPAPVLCPASARGPVVFHQGQPVLSALSAAVAMVGSSESLPVILRPDEVSEALMVGVNELLSLYGIH